MSPVPQDPAAAYRRIELDARVEGSDALELARVCLDEAIAQLRRAALAEARGNRELADQPGEGPAALPVLGPLAVLDVRPFAVAGHAVPAPTPRSGLATRTRRRGARIGTATTTRVMIPQSPRAGARRPRSAIDGVYGAPVD